jgi:hypothetical protein
MAAEKQRTFRFDELMKLLPKITIRVPPCTGPAEGRTSITTGGGGPVQAKGGRNKKKRRSE